MEYRSQPLSQSAAFGSRYRASLVLVLLVLLLFTGRVAYLTTVRGGEYRSRAVDNLECVLRLEAPRGNILDRHGEPLALNRRAYSLTYSRYGRTRDEIFATLDQVGIILGEDYGLKSAEILETRPSWTRHTLARRLTQKQAIAFLERPQDYPGLRVQADFRREYPLGVVTAGIVGFLGKIPPDAVDRYTRPLYLPDAFIGRSGLESHYEQHLVGKPGRQRLTRDARGNLLEEPDVEQVARAGDDLLLSLDSHLQQVAWDLLEGHKGSIILMDVNTGEIHALASRPTFDPMNPGLAEIDGEPVSWINRAYQGGYPPGSTFKLISASAALRQGWDPHERIACRGHYNWPGWLRSFHCNVRTGHGPMDMMSSLQRSCNVTFYEIGHRLGPELLLAETRRWGFGEATGIDLPGERAGRVPAQVPAGSPGEVLNLSIGQGALVASPLQVAVAFATFANGGDIVAPRVVSAIQSGDGGAPVALPRQVRGRVALDAASREVIMEGLWRVVNVPGGNAYSSHFPREWDACGKTGTAENGQGGLDAWFVAFYPRRAPRFVAIAHLEGADDHGGTLAAPLIRDLIAAQMKPNTDHTELAASP